MTALLICRLFEVCFNFSIGSSNIHKILQPWFETVHENDGNPYPK